MMLLSGKSLLKGGWQRSRFQIVRQHVPRARHLLNVAWLGVKRTKEHQLGNLANTFFFPPQRLAVSDFASTHLTRDPAMSTQKGAKKPSPADEDVKLAAEAEVKLFLRKVQGSSRSL